MGDAVEDHSLELPVGVPHWRDVEGVGGRHVSGVSKDSGPAWQATMAPGSLARRQQQQLSCSGLVWLQPGAGVGSWGVLRPRVGHTFAWQRSTRTHGRARRSPMQPRAALTFQPWLGLPLLGPLANPSAGLSRPGLRFPLPPVVLWRWRASLC